MSLPDAHPNPASHQKRRWLVFAPFVIFVALAVLLFFRLFAGDASKLPSALIGKEVPPFTLAAVEGLDGRPGFSDADLRQGHVTVMNVFASWCVPCHQEHHLLMALSADKNLTDKGVEVVGLAYKDEPENVRRFLGEAGDPFKRIGADVAGRVAIDWGVYGVPETFVIRGDGTIAYKYVGPLDGEAVEKVLLPEIAKAIASGSKGAAASKN